MEYKIQSFVFPNDPKHMECADLFYRGNGIESINNTLRIPAGVTCNMNTYLNACSAGKWRLYTPADHFKLQLDMEGICKVTFNGYHLNEEKAVEKNFGEIQKDDFTRENLKFEYPGNEESLLCCSIFAETEVVLYGGFFTVEVEQSQLNMVNLGIATTTMKKEDFIRKNIALLKKEIIESEEDIHDHLFVHVVDNGRTLHPYEIEGKNVWLHPNNNAGGSGGYARGMMECVHQSGTKLTNVLLMDDDVLVLPESIIRTYNLLRLSKPEYKDSFIAGAMLQYEKPYVQFEDIGTVLPNGYYQFKKGKINHQSIEGNLFNEKDFGSSNNEYAAWWYCCMPISAIKQNGLPLPFFIRVDDAEYSLRCRPNIMTMNGISIWHMGFGPKYSAAMDCYQETRNKMLAKAITGVMADVDMFRFWYVNHYRQAFLDFNYQEVEVSLRVMEDYLKGPEFLMEDRGLDIVKSNSALNEVYQPLSVFTDQKLEVSDEPGDHIGEDRKNLKTILCRLTWNGQKYWPEALLSNKMAVVPHGHWYLPQVTAFHKRILAVNHYDNTATLREMNRQRFYELQKRGNELIRRYKETHKDLERRYREAATYLTSEEFWRKYLQLDEEK